jgi:hypothetical protein
MLAKRVANLQFAGTAAIHVYMGICMGFAPWFTRRPIPGAPNVADAMLVAV